MVEWCSLGRQFLAGLPGSTGLLINQISAVIEQITAMWSVTFTITGQGAREYPKIKQKNPYCIVLGSLVQSGLLSNFDKTETWTSPHKLTNLEKLD